MKKHKKKMKIWKKILLGLIVILLAVAAYILYLFQFKEYDTVDSEVTEITRETYKIELPDGSAIEMDENGNIIETSGNGSSDTGSTDGTTNDGSSSNSGTVTNGNSGNTGTSGSNGSTTGNSGSTGNGNGSSGGTTGSNNGTGTGTGTGTGNNTGSGATVASIKSKYEPVMADLQAQANGRIDALVGRAYSEYQGKKETGDSINYAYFYSKYTSAAAELEARTDKVFYQVLAVVEKELVANGYGKTHAQSFVTKYEAEKEARRSSLLDKAMNR
ncbi:hypothetical protein [Paenisporosarcina indica]|uniref:hypothetical protein n=1 Tax=Paenisporosarcina indica TaxID=650093 RepID=UPI00094FC997|nr:hypothetical protein [Paenisporosarcina indica]